MSERPVAPANFVDWRERSRSFEQLAAYRVRGGNLVSGATPENIDRALNRETGTRIVP